MYYALETFNITGRKLQFYDFYKSLPQARKDAKQLLADGTHRVVIHKEGSNTKECCAKWTQVEEHKA